MAADTRRRQLGRSDDRHGERHALDILGALVGGAMAGGFEGVLSGSGILWMVASFGDVLLSGFASIYFEMVRTAAADAH